MTMNPAAEAGNPHSYLCVVLMLGVGCPEVSSSQRTTEDGGADKPSVASDPAWQRRTTDGGHNRRTTEETDASMADDIGYRSTTDTELGDPPAGGHRHRRTRSRCSHLPAHDDLLRPAEQHATAWHSLPCTQRCSVCWHADLVVCSHVARQPLHTVVIHKMVACRLEEAAGADLTLFGNRKDAEPEGKKRKPAAQPETPSPYSACKYVRLAAAVLGKVLQSCSSLLTCTGVCSPVDVAIMRMLDESGDPSAVLHRRTSAFKVIPRIPEGSWVVKQAVGSTPVLLGNKLTTQFHRYSAPTSAPMEGWGSVPSRLCAQLVIVKQMHCSSLPSDYIIRA